MKSAREDDAIWAQICDALGITKRAAHNFYRRKIEDQENYLPDLHDATAARASARPSAAGSRHAIPVTPGNVSRPVEVGKDGCSGSGTSLFR